MKKVLDIEYICQKCGEKSPEDWPSMICQCGGELRGHGFPGLTGTRDNFGVFKEFVDEKSGKVIDNWKKWERAGYKQPEDCIKNPVVREHMKRKKEQLAGSRQKQLAPNQLPI